MYNTVNKRDETSIVRVISKEDLEDLEVEEDRTLRSTKRTTTIDYLQQHKMLPFPC